MYVTYDPLLASKAQEEYCAKYHLPVFAPSYNAGCICTRCGGNIYRQAIVFDNVRTEGYSVQYAATHLITGCPFCHNSFCD